MGAERVPGPPLRLPGLLLLAATLVLAAGCGGTRTVVRTVTATTTMEQSTPGVAKQRWYGHVRSIVPSPQGGYLLTFDPAWLLSGVTANFQQALEEGRRCRPLACPPVPNDNLELDESDATIVFRLPSGTTGTVLTQRSGVHGESVTAAELAAIVNGTSPLKLFEPLDSGVWLTVRVDTVTGFEQQYKP
jgi:hypothetical protein